MKPSGDTGVVLRPTWACSGLPAPVCGGRWRWGLQVVLAEFSLRRSVWSPSPPASSWPTVWSSPPTCSCPSQTAGNMSKMNAASSDSRFYPICWRVSAPYVSDEFVDLVSADVVDGHHRVQGGVADRIVPVSDVDGDLLQGFGRGRLAHVQPEALDQTAQLLQTLWAEQEDTKQENVLWNFKTSRLRCFETFLKVAGVETDRTETWLQLFKWNWKSQTVGSPNKLKLLNLKSGLFL